MHQTANLDYVGSNPTSTFKFILTGDSMDVLSNVYLLIDDHGYSHLDATQRVLREAQCHIDDLDEKLQRSLSKLSERDANAIINDKPFNLSPPSSTVDYVRPNNHY